MIVYGPSMVFYLFKNLNKLGIKYRSYLKWKQQKSTHSKNVYIMLLLLPEQWLTNYRTKEN